MVGNLMDHSIFTCLADLLRMSPSFQGGTGLTIYDAASVMMAALCSLVVTPKKLEDLPISYRTLTRSLGYDCAPGDMT